MRNSKSSQNNKTAQTLIVFGLFLLVLWIAYTFFFKSDEPDLADDSTVNTSRVGGSTLETNKASPLKAKKTKESSNDEVVDFKKIVADSVNKRTQSSVSKLNLVDAKGIRANNSYRYGLNAYLNKNYSLAYSSWKASAQLNHPKAYFNLGLLASNPSIANSLNGIKDANYYFKKAKKYGYLPAAKLLSGEIAYEPAEEDEAAVSAASFTRSNESTQETYQETASQVKTQAASQIVEQQRSQEQSVESSSKLGGVDWIKSQATNNWTIQVRAFKDKNELDAFLNAYEFGKNTAYFREPTSQGIMYKLVIGTFASRDTASEARGSLPADVLAKGPWLRRFSDIKKTMIGY